MTGEKGISKMQEFAERLYKSKAWAKCRKGYMQSVGGLCERCLKAGRINPAVIVHHKTHITPENISNPEITLSYSNLEALCRQCHGEAHSDRVHRYTVDALGRVVPV